MNAIRDIVRRLMIEEKKVLGRWNMAYSHKTMKIKIDLSNVDHCGPCGQYLVDTNKKPENEVRIESGVQHPRNSAI
jgi:hypothetical protein